eukprot:3749563-Prymnesium_polylepis.1
MDEGVRVSELEESSSYLEGPPGFVDVDLLSSCLSNAMRTTVKTTPLSTSPPRPTSVLSRSPPKSGMLAHTRAGRGALRLATHVSTFDTQ